jgi:hypothetical protein
MSAGIDPVDAARAELRRLSVKVPPHTGWSYQTTIDYKDVLVEASKLLKSPKATAGKLAACSNKLRAYLGE